MKIGVGAPTTLPGTSGDLVIDWSRRADEGPFASLGVVDRIVYEGIESLIALAAAAAVTERIELVTSILIAPLRETSTLAKQVASLATIAPGRTTLGVAIGARGDDYEASEFGRAGRGHRLGTQLAELRAALEGDRFPLPDDHQRPRVLVGGGSGPAYARAARYADGWIHGGSPPRVFARSLAEARGAWSDAERPGEPEVWSMAYYALGDGVDEGRQYMLDYYGFTGAFAQRIADGLLTTPLAIREYVQAYSDAGCDHLLLFPTVADPDQLDLLAEVVDS